MSAIFIIVLTGLISLVLTCWLSGPGAPIRLMDQPNERSLHAKPMPRTGGLALVTALLAGWVTSLILVEDGNVPIQMLSGALLVAAVSILDDRYRLSQGPRLLVQFGAALLLVRDGFVVMGEFLPGAAFTSEAIAVVFTILATLWLTNLYNFMDGMDGFAGGMAVIGFGTLAALGASQGDVQFAGAALVVAAAAAGFLWFNFPPARIFMGDSGSTTLGFLVAAFAIWASRRGVAPVWLTLLVFSPFVVDATVTLVRRALCAEPVWQAHRTHYYQRLVQLGWGHRRTVLAEYAIMLVCGAAALTFQGSDLPVQWGVLALFAGGYVWIIMGVHRLEAKQNVRVSE